MYGLINKITAVPEQRDLLIEILEGSSRQMPGCISYVIGKDISDENAIWITEVWESEQTHQASLNIAAVRAAINKARPLMSGFSKIAVTEPVKSRGPK